MVWQIHANYMEVKEAQGNNTHVPAAEALSTIQLDFNITGYYPSQDKIIYLWDVQWCERVIEADKERTK